ncbi:insulinase family protein [Longimicrobium terrae]|uniref:Putative Zn-dependent peptidase n=1 Tax=Longimicrobium terrae TaxID=1639882 RepID=A0A841H0C3_9BACT|nr:insulinase family protein [Longimicrobium terrae]MBB4637223.1 putative Zn-dependent peptidase [Longimicrobium terrae]MBB6071515.1 putative Zn-dependent peptidase [Longimicrobium terrae]NNC30063.1 insulinase family protein [Longimicrobium terrae]
MLNLLLALGLAVADSVPPPRPAAMPAVVVHRQPALPIVALRLSVLADDPPGYAGAGHLMQHLHLPRLEDRVARVGGRVQAERTSDAVVYTVVGPASELAYLAEALQATLAAPTPATPELLSAMAALNEERGSEREVAASYIRGALRARLFPQDLSAAGTETSAARLAVARLEDVWGAMYRPDRVSIVAVGDVQIDEVRRAFRDVTAGSPQPLEAFADTVRALAADTPQATRGWLARGWNASELDPAAVTVTTRLIRTQLRRRMTRSSVDVEHWWTHDGQAVALVLATPDSLVPVARRSADAALATVAAAVDDAAVRDAAAGVRREMLFFARTPERMAEVLGAFGDRGLPADAPQRFFAAVEQVTADDVRAVLAALRAQDVVAVDVPAQRLRRGT